MKTIVYLPLLVPLLLKMCSGSGKSEDRIPLAKVGSEVVYLDEAVQGMPKGLSAKDSTLYVAQFLKARVKDLLLYEKASKNIPQSDAIDEMVENYRRSLLVHAYQQEYLNERMQREITDTEVQVFYENNRDRFEAGHDLLKGLFIKVPKSAPGMDKLRKWYRDPDSEELQHIESFCVQNGGRFDYFMDRWVLFSDVMGSVSYSVGNASDFLRTHTTLDVTSGDYEYFLYINDYVLAGSTAPLEYVKDEVRSVLANTRRTEFLRRFEQDLLRQAQKQKKITYYKVDQKTTK
jgi:hypothetical protein